MFGNDKKTSGNSPICVVIDNGSTTRRMGVVYPDGSREIIRGKGPNGIFTSAVFCDGDNWTFDADAQSMSAQNPELGAAYWKGRLGSDEKFIKGRFTAEELEAKYTAYQISVGERQLGVSLKGLPMFASRSHSVSDRGSAAISRAAEKAGLIFGQFISEQAAVVLGYTMEKNLASRPDWTFFVADSGGFSWDFCTGIAGGGRLDIKGTRSVPNLAGIEMSRRLGELVLAKGAKQFGINNIDISKYDPDTRFQFDQRMELGKINLSMHKSVQFTVTNPDNGKIKSVPITQEEYHTEILNPILKQLRGSVEQTLSDAKMVAKDVEFLIGSGAPMVNRYLCEWLGKQFGRPMECDVDPSMAVIRGVAAFGFNELTKEGKTKVFGVPEITITDRLPALVAIMMHLDGDTSETYAIPLFEKDSPVPSEAIIRGSLLHKNQDSVYIQIAQAPRPHAKMAEVAIIGRGELTGLPRELIMTDRLEFRGKLRSGGITDVLVTDLVSKLSTLITAQVKN